MSANPTYWKMRNGESISIDDMDCHHVKNVLKMKVMKSILMFIRKEFVLKLDFVKWEFEIGWMWLIIQILALTT